MAQNQEKAQAVLYRFRQAQAAELGVKPFTPGKRPTVANGITSLRECERWRASVMSDLERKVSKIQDYGLNEYEIRDLNDEINQLFRQKMMWEKHIMALGGANYINTSARLMDDEGSLLPGTRGYKYFGRAKDLPGVKEMFNRTAAQEEELESYRTQKFRRFQNQTGAYFGNEDEDDGVLLDEEIASENHGWEQGSARIASALELPQDTDFPSIPRAPPTKLTLHAPRANDTPDTVAPNLNALDANELRMPDVPERKDIETFLLRAKKAALRNEYLGEPSTV